MERMLVWTSALALGSFVVGCGDNMGRVGDGDGSGSGSANPPPPPPIAMVTIDTGGPAALVAYRAESSPTWVSLPINGATKFSFAMPAGPYRMAVVCDGGDGFVDIEEFARMPDDDATVNGVCFAAGDTLFHLTGTAVQSGELAYAGSGFGEFGDSAVNWPFDMEVVGGTNDLVMISGPFGSSTGFAIRRDLTVTADQDLGTVDLTEGAQAPVDLELTGDILPGEMRETRVTFQSGATSVMMENTVELGTGGGPTWIAHLAPPGLLRATDKQLMGLSAFIPASDTVPQFSIRELTRDAQSNPSTTVVLPDPLAATFTTSGTQLTAAWVKLPDALDDVLVEQDAFNDDFSVDIVYDLALSQRFVAATGATSVSLDVTDLPGFQAAWQPDPSLARIVELIASGTSMGDAMQSVVAEATGDASIEPRLGQALRGRPRSLVGRHRLLGRR